MPEPQPFSHLVRLSTADHNRLGEIISCTQRFQRERRARVLKYKDLAARLCAPPLSYTSPDQWTGYVPPRTGQEQAPDMIHSGAPWGEHAGRPNAAGRHTGPTELNIAATRAALVELCGEAWARDIAGGIDPGPTEHEALAALPFPARRALAAASPPALPAAPVQATLEPAVPADDVPLPDGPADDGDPSFHGDGWLGAQPDPDGGDGVGPGWPDGSIGGGVNP